MADDGPVVTRHLRILGRVQGVGYRDALCIEAVRLGVAGWVRNLRDGTVEAVVHGRAVDVEALTTWARRGPPLARVSGIESRPAEASLAAPGAGFQRRPTV